MADRKFRNNRYFDKTLLNRNDLPVNGAFINITHARSNHYTRDAKKNTGGLCGILQFTRCINSMAI